jgi:hypothetical protein
MSYEQALKERYVEARWRLGAGPKPRTALVQRVCQQRPVPAAPAPVVETKQSFQTAADMIIREVAAKHGLTLAEIKATRRKVKIVDARYEVFFRLSKETSMSLPMIGKKLGGYDHTTVLHGIRMHEKRMAEGYKRAWRGPQPKREPVFGVGGWH